MVIFSDNYINTLTKQNKTYKDILKEINSYSEMHGFDEEEAVYFFILKIIKKRLYFDFDIKEYDELLYDAIYWASKEENKKKTRPKRAKDIKISKDVNKYIVLQKEVFKLLHEQYGEELLFDEYMVKYFTIFFELSSIKRDRR